ncbi:MAG: hypothetical protein K6F92_00245 [Lachnospiraceae bacterium]|nr:hypothetical protein [Lachnospiraceae bacterium]
MLKRVKSIVLNNITLKLLAVVIAFFTWFAVMYNLNPINTKKIKVPVEIMNDEAITDQNWVYDVVGEGTVEITVTAKSFDLVRIAASDFEVYVDMRYLTGSTNTEKQGTIEYKILNNADIIEEISLSETSMYFNLEEIVSRTYTINIVTSGSAAEDYVAASEPTAVPSTITVSGRSSDVYNIASVAYYLNINDASEEINETGTPVLLDSTGKVIEDTSKLTISPQTVQIVQPIMQTKTVKIVCDETTGDPAVGYSVSDIELDVSTIKIAGYKAIISGVTQVEIPASVIDVENLTQAKTYEVDLSSLTLEQMGLPEGVSFVSTNTTVNVTVKIEKFSRKIYRLAVPDDISIAGKSDLYDYSFDDTLVNITLVGTSTDLANTEAANIQADLNLTGYTAGSWSVPLVITLPEGLEVAANVEVVVNITEKVTETETPEETTTEEPTTTEPVTESETEPETESETEPSSEDITSEEVLAETTVADAPAQTEESSESESVEETAETVE